MELLRGTMRRHSLIVYRDDYHRQSIPNFDGNDWLSYIPILLPETISVEEQLPPGAVVELINQSHTDQDIYLPINATEKQLYKAIDGKRSVGAILENLTIDPKLVRSFFERLWWYDQVVFKALS